MALHDARGLQLEGAARLGGNGAESVQRVAERVDDPAEVGVADRHREHLAGAGDLHALHDVAELAEDDDTDLVLVEAQRQAEGPIREPDELIRHDAREAFDVRDAVCGVYDVADLGLGRLARLVGLDEVLQRLTDLIRADR